jgi:hypothetical protein
MAKEKATPTRTLYKSECGQYFCRVSPRGWGNFEAWTLDGSLHWRDDNRHFTWADEGRYRHPMAYAVGAFSAETTGQKSGSFTLTLLHCDVAKEIQPYQGNTIIESLDVVFRRKVPPQHQPKWLREGRNER